jgi:protein N-terminal methyltransferase
VQHVLIKLFDKVDLLEPTTNLIKQAKDALEPNYKEKIGHYYQTSMIEFIFEEKYDLIWFQWVVGHLTDRDFIDLMKKCALSLTDIGVIVLKENFASAGYSFYLDKEDHTVMRSKDYFLQLFDKAGLEVITIEKFENFPKDLLSVYKICLRPLRKASKKIK